MAQLMFFDQDHRYELDGVVLPSVSEIIRFMSREAYGNVQQWTLDNAAGRGTRVHKATQAIDTFGTVECEDDIAPYVQAYVAFLKDYHPEWTDVERATHNAELGYAGTIDRAGILDGQRVIVDIKAQESIKRPLVTAQLNGYALMKPCEALKCLQLTRNGKYKLHDIDINTETFLSCLALHNAMKTKKRRATNE